MDRPKRFAPFVFSIGMITGAIPAFGQSNQPPIYRRVPHDVETRVIWQGAWVQRTPGFCSVRFIPALQVVSQPLHGTLRLATDLNAPRGSGCSNPISGAAIYYKPNPGFTGQDRFAVNLPEDPTSMNHLGVASGNHMVVITVR